VSLGRRYSQGIARFVKPRCTVPASSRIVRHLFYHRLPGVEWARRRLRGLRIHPRGIVPASGGAQTKILWIDYRRRSVGPMRVAGVRLDAAGRFHQTFAGLGPSTRAEVTVLATGR
jgi:hypothetical protein